MDFSTMFYKMIGNRIRQIKSNTKEIEYIEKDSNQLTKGKPILDNIPVDNKLMSAIQNGKCTDDNRYFLTNNSAYQICKTFKLELDYLVFGDKEEQEKLIKLLLLGILFNGIEYNSERINPFIYFDSDEDFLLWVEYKNMNNPPPEPLYSAINVYRTTGLDKDGKIIINENDSISFIELISQLTEWAKNDYGFFFSQENYNYFQLLNDTTDASLQKLSDLLFKPLINDWDLCKNYTERIYNRISNSNIKDVADYVEDTHYVPIDDSFKLILIHPSSFLLTAIDYKESEYYRFVHAFNRFWNNNKNVFLDFFNIHFFSKINNNRLLKDLINKKIMEILRSEAFFDLCNTTTILDNYTNIESVFSSTFYRLTLQELYTRTKAKNSLDKHYADLLLDSRKTIHKWKK